jgi:hypothetical protein
MNNYDSRTKDVSVNFIEIWRNYCVGTAKKNYMLLLSFSLNQWIVKHSSPSNSATFYVSAEVRIIILKQ